MSKKISIFTYEILSSIFIFIVGTLLHFTYEWSGNNIFVGIFSSINESVWEHLKLLFFPMLITAIIGFFYYRDLIPNYLCSKVKGILISMLFIIVFFYTYTGIIGKNIAFFDISSFFVAVILGQYYAYKKIKNNEYCNNVIGILILLILFVAFAVFTFFPPDFGIFIDGAERVIDLI